MFQNNKLTEKEALNLLPQDIHDELVSILTVLSLTNSYIYEHEIYDNLNFISFTFKKDNGRFIIAFVFDKFMKNIIEVSFGVIIGSITDPQDTNLFSTKDGFTSLEILDIAKDYV